MKDEQITFSDQSATAPKDTVIEYNCSNCNGCGSSNTNTHLPFQELPFVLVTVVLFVLLVIKKNKQKILFWSIGLVIFAALILKVEQSQINNSNVGVIIHNNETVETQKGEDVALANDFNEFIPDTTDEFQSFEKFEAFESTNEFEAFDDIEQTSGSTNEKEYKSLFRTLLALSLTIALGILFRRTKNNVLRYGVLLASLIYFGFYGGGCPCMISSFQHFILLLLGEKVSWISLVWFIGLLPITYFFGKIWCGWVCHLGALQEFLYRPGRVNKMLSPTFQKVLKTIQVTAFLALVVQLIWTRTNLFIKFDPFKVAFNLYSAKLIGYILLSILLASSLLIYRPFCSGFCPVGLILGWVEKIPGAFGLHVTSACKSCSKCKKICSYQAITQTNSIYKINKSECIMCGECVNACKFKAITTAQKLNTK